MNTTTLASAPGQAIDDVARRHPGLVTIARLGWFAKGIVYLLLGALAVPVAWHGLTGDVVADDEASQTGAIARIAESSLGEVALWVVAIGLLLYVLWRIVSILLPTDGSAKAWVTRVGYAISAVTYAVLAWTAISLARGEIGGAESEESKVDRYSRTFLEHSWGRWLVGAIGVALIGVGVYFVYRGVAAKFRNELDPGGVGPISGDQIVVLGRIGWCGRGVVMGTIGWFLLQAAVDFRPEEAVGFDGALRELTNSTAGAMAALVVAVALAIYGVFCIVATPKVRLKGAT